MAEDGNEKVYAAIQQIVKSLGHNESMVNDILQVYSNFDGRFSREKLSEKLASDDPRSCAALDNAIDSLHRRISHYLAADHPIWSSSSDAAEFLQVVDELISTVSDWSRLSHADKAIGACLVRADDLLQQVMFRIEDEFRSLLESGAESTQLETTANSSSDSEVDDDEENDADNIPVAKPVTDFDIVIDALPPGTIKDLQEMAKRMVAAGFGKECSHAYSTCRREFLEESFSRLGLQKLSIEEVHKMPWESLESEISRWINAVKVSLRILFPSERHLCDRVFFGSSSAADLAFMEVCRGSTIQLLNFADAIAIGSRAPERLFKILDVFETMRDLLPDFESVFSDQYCLVLKTEAITIWKRLGESIRGIFMELENLIRRDPAKAAVPGGNVHPITRYVMNYLRAACQSRDTLEQVFEESGVSPRDYGKIDDRAPSSPLSVQMAWIMELLESNLEAKSKIYRDSALCSVFMMNNGRYIVKKVKDSELGSLLGDDWIRKHTAKIRQYHVSYQRSSWNKILGVLKQENRSLASKSMKEKMKLFNIYFEEICKQQSTWVIFDEQLREELKISVSGNLLPAYRNFIGRFQISPEVGKYADKYIKYNMDDVEARINELFQGSSGSPGGRK